MIGTDITESIRKGVEIPIKKISTEEELNRVALVNEYFKAMWNIQI